MIELLWSDARFGSNLSHSLILLLSQLWNLATLCAEVTVEVKCCSNVRKEEPYGKDHQKN